jgi:hypothetical protein
MIHWTPHITERKKKSHKSLTEDTEGKRLPGRPTSEQCITAAVTDIARGDLVQAWVQ